MTKGEGIRCIVALCATVAGCSSPTAPTINHTGQWQGVSAQNMPIFFSVSPEETVTDITIAFQYNGCTGSQSFSNLSLPITPQGGFSLQAGVSPMGPTAEVNGMLQAGRAQGTINFREYPQCGSAVAGVTWNAAKR